MAGEDIIPALWSRIRARSIAVNLRPRIRVVDLSDMAGEVGGGIQHWTLGAFHFLGRRWQGGRERAVIHFNILNRDLLVLEDFKGSGT